MMTRLIAVLMAVSAFAAPIEPAKAKDADVSTLSAEGRASIRPRPTALRMEIELRKFGATAEIALKRLTAGRERAAARLAGLGLAKSRIVAGPPRLERMLPPVSGDGPSRVTAATVSPGSTPPTGALLVSRSTTAARAGRRIALAARDDQLRTGQQLYMAVQNLTIDCPLGQEDVESLLVAAHEFQSKVVEADLAGAREPSELTAGERRLLEAAAELRFAPDFQEELSAADLALPGEILFRYVARLTPEQSKQLQARAFAEAKARASALAEVTGSKLGRIFDISCQHEAAVSDDDYALIAAGHFHGASGEAGPARAGAAGNETSGLDLGSLQFTAVMSVMFYLD